jgi:thiol-disulfide isomerase/thioredoxin
MARIDEVDMKRTKNNLWASFFLFSVLIFAISCAKEGKNAFSYTPREPSPGDTIEVRYSPRESVFQDADKVQMLVYVYTNGFPEVTAVEMEKEGRSWSGSFTPDSNSYGAAVKFQTGEAVDNNRKVGYFIPFYAEEGGLVPGAMAGQAEALASWGDLLMETNLEPANALQLFDAEFKAHTEMRKKFLYPYIRTLIQVKPEGWEDTALAAADSVASEEDLDEDALNTLVNSYRQLKKPDKMETIVAKAKEMFPEGYQAQYARFQEFNKEQDLDKKSQILERFKADFPQSNMIGTMAYYMVREYLGKDRIEDLKTYMKDSPDIKEPYVYNMAATQLLDRGQELDFASGIIQKGIRLVEQQLDDPGQKPGYYTQKEWEEQTKKYSLSSMVATYGRILAKQGHEEEALMSFERAVEMSEGSNPELNESYVRALMAGERYQKAYDRLAGFIEEGKSSASMKDMLKTAYAKVKGGEEGFEAYFDTLDTAATDRLREELQKEMMNEPAPAFSLEDLDGIQVSLASLKGKTFVLDFWAVWCGPCVSSFPGMKRVVEKYQDDPSVEFFFVNTWENEEDKRKNALDYITEKDYPFHVLLDTEDEVVSAFKVRGIPTKFIVDKKGNIRFTKIGYDGNDEKMIKELDLMIDMVR